MWIKADHWKPDKKDETVMDILYEKDESQAWKEKINLCRLRCKVLWVDDLYGVDGILHTSVADMEHEETNLRWPNTPIPKR